MAFRVCWLATYTLNLFAHSGKLLGTKLKMSSSRHPETDILVERLTSNFQQLLRVSTCYDGDDLVNRLPQVKFAYEASRALERWKLSILFLWRITASLLHSHRTCC
jgi:hypothetical protein